MTESEANIEAKKRARAARDAHILLNGYHGWPATGVPADVWDESNKIYILVQVRVYTELRGKHAPKST